MNTSQSILSDITTYMKYARHIPEKSRRETWEETVDRWWNYFTGKVPTLASRPDIRTAILNLEVLQK